MLHDPSGRPLNNLRVSVNEACNLRCSYCHLEGGAMTAGDVTPDEYARLFRIAADVGIRALKITGGEPTLHPDLAKIVAAGDACFAEVSMTTNGVLLSRLARPLAEAGLDRVNVSLDTLQAETYRSVTGVAGLERTIAGIRAARASGLDPVKINMVVLAGINEHEIEAMEAFAAAEGVELQLIELHTDRTNAAGIDFAARFASLAHVESALRRRSTRVGEAKQHGRPRFHLSHAGDRDTIAETVVEVVRPYANPDFCAKCHRMRLTGDGALKPCLMRFDNYVDILGPLRSGAADSELERLFRLANERRAPYWTTTHTRKHSAPLPALPVLG